MNESLIAVRYTKALFASATEKNVLEQVKKDIDFVYSLLNESADLMLFFQNPIIKPSKKSEIVHLIFKDFNPLSISFIDLLISNRREEYLHEVSMNFIDRYRLKKGIESANFTTAVKVDDNLLDSVKNILKDLFKKDIELSSQVNEKIIGGFVLRIGDKQFDASIQTNLNKLRRKLTHTTIN